jgi:hypothetical protein
VNCEKREAAGIIFFAASQTRILIKIILKHQISILQSYQAMTLYEENA